MNENHEPSASHRDPTRLEIRETRQALAPFGLAHGLITNPAHAKLCAALPQLPPARSKARAGAARAKRLAPLTPKQQASRVAQERRWAAVLQGRTSPPAAASERARRAEKRQEQLSRQVQHEVRNIARAQEASLQRAAQHAPATENVSAQ